MVQTLDPRAGGVASAVLALSRGLARRGHKIDIVTLDKSHSSQTAHFSVHALGSGVTSYRYSNKLFPWLRAHGGEYDRVIVNGLWQYLSFASWRRFAGSAITLYIFPHGMRDPGLKRTFSIKTFKKWPDLTWAASTSPRMPAPAAL